MDIILVAGFVALAWGLSILATWIVARQAQPSDAWQHMLMTTLFAVMNEGRQAFHYGIQFTESPYVRGSPDNRAWLIGWHKANLDALDLKRSLMAVEESKRDDDPT